VDYGSFILGNYLFWYPSNEESDLASMGILMNHTGFIRISCCFFASLSHQAFSLFDTERSGAIDARELKADSCGEWSRKVLKFRLFGTSKTPSVFAVACVFDRAKPQSKTDLHKFTCPISSLQR